MFRVSTTPIIRSTQNRNYSLRYWSYFLCSYLPPTWLSLATLQGGSNSLRSMEFRDRFIFSKGGGSLFWRLNEREAPLKFQKQNLTLLIRSWNHNFTECARYIIVYGKEQVYNTDCSVGKPTSVYCCKFCLIWNLTQHDDRTASLRLLWYMNDIFHIQ